MRPCECANLPEPWLLANAMSTKILCAGSLYIIIIIIIVIIIIINNFSVADFVIHFPCIYFRLLEFYILNGSQEGAIDHVIKDLSDHNRNNPQELDKAMISFLREVLRYKDEDHIKAARKIRID